MRRLGFVVMAAAVASAIGLAAQGPRAGGPSCDRRCLLQVMFEYTEAITDNDLSKVPLSPKVRATNNGTETPLGKGDIWGPARRLPYRQVFVDPVTGAAIFYGVVTMSTRPPQPGGPALETPRWWYYVARLKVEARRITEVEEIAYEPPANGFGATPSSMTLPDRIFDTVLLESERSRASSSSTSRTSTSTRCPTASTTAGPVAPRVPAHRARCVHGQSPAHGGQLRRRVPDPLGVVERGEPTVLHRRRRARRSDSRREFHGAEGISHNNPSVVMEAVQGAGRHDPAHPRLLPRERSAEVGVGQRPGGIASTAA
jgi:hypothetical protein